MSNLQRRCQGCGHVFDHAPAWAQHEVQCLNGKAEARKVRPWGCPKCGARDSRVLDTAYDESGYPVRRRRCIECDARWSTEEVPIHPSAFFARGYVWDGKRYRHRRKAEGGEGRPRGAAA